MIERYFYNDTVEKKLIVSRKGFLKVSILTLLSLYLSGYLQIDKPNEANCNPKKFLIITDAHLGKKDSSIFQANADAEKTLRFIFKYLKGGNFDRAYGLGDNTIDGSPQESRRNYSVYFSCLNELDIPQTQIDGNHDEWNLDREERVKIRQQNGLSDRFYSVDQYDGFQVVSADIVAKPQLNASMSGERIEWIRSVAVRPTILLLHQGIELQDMSKNIYFKTNPKGSILANSQEVKKALEGLPIFAIVSGHTHQGLAKSIDGVAHISLPSFSERRFPNMENPGVISTMDVNGSRIKIRSFSKGKCVFNIEI